MTLNDSGASSDLENVDYGMQDQTISTVDLFDQMQDDENDVDNGADSGEDDAKDDNADDKETLAGSDDGEKSDNSEKKSNSQDFHEHPRFKEIIKSNQELKERLIRAEALLEAGGKGSSKTDSGEPDQNLPFRDISKMSPEELQDWNEDNPKEFYENLISQVTFNVANSMSAKTQEETREAKLASTFENYAKENEDFNEMWESGAIPKFMEENPGHNAISAHMQMTADARTQAKIDEAVKAAETKIINDLKAKGKTRSLPSGPSGSRQSNAKIPQELANPSKFGGIENVLVQRHLKRMRGL